jgi:hypothetical protein
MSNSLLTFPQAVLYFQIISESFMNPMPLALLGGTTLIASITLSYSNPTFADYRKTILTRVANNEAERFAAADRRAIEHEAVRLTSQFAAVQYDPAKLDAARIQSNHPRLGASLIHRTGTSARTLTETLALSKDHALRRVEATREVIHYALLAKLGTQTARVSYGVWSVYTTCADKLAFSYIGLAGRFFERTDRTPSTCPPTRNS